MKKFIKYAWLPFSIIIFGVLFVVMNGWFLLVAAAVGVLVSASLVGAEVANHYKWFDK